MRRNGFDYQVWPGHRIAVLARSPQNIPTNNKTDALRGEKTTGRPVQSTWWTICCSGWSCVQSRDALYWWQCSLNTPVHVVANHPEGGHSADANDWKPKQSCRQLRIKISVWNPSSTVTSMISWWAAIEDYTWDAFACGSAKRKTWMCEFMGNFCGVCVALSFGVMTYLVSQGNCHFFLVTFTSVRATKNVILWQTLFLGQCFVVVEFHQILESCQELG